MMAFKKILSSALVALLALVSMPLAVPGTDLVNKAHAAGWCEIEVTTWLENLTTGDTAEYWAWADSVGNHFESYTGELNAVAGDRVDVSILGGGQGRDGGPFELRGWVDIAGASMNDSGEIHRDFTPGDPHGQLGTHFIFTKGTDPVWLSVGASCREMDDGAGVGYEIDILPPSPDFSCTVTPANRTIDAGSNTSYTIETEREGGFNRPITFSAELDPLSGSAPNPPTVSSYSGNGQVPPATTIANINTEENTTPGGYNVIFTGTADNGETTTCETDLQVNGLDGDFNLIVTPLGTPENPVKSLVGNDVVFQVFAECLGDFNGPITAMEARTTFTGLQPPLLGANQLNCGGTTTLIVRNTQTIISSELSVFPNNIRPKDVFVAGSGQL